MSLSEPASRAVFSGISASSTPAERHGCHAVVELLLGRVPFAAAILTAEGRIELLNRAMADALGATMAELGGADLVERYASDGSRRAARAELALLGAGVQAYARVRLDVGGITNLQVEPVVGAPGFFLATAAKELDQNADESAAFELSTRAEEYGRVLRRAAGGVWFDVPAGTRCLDLLCGNSGCCADCPAMAISEKTPIVSRATAAGEGHCYVVTARWSSPDRALVTAIRIDETTRAKLATARVDAAASAAGLSEREKQVLRSLLLGRELAEIAAELGISHRTVRFHQYNLLEKLGVESRADLARLLL